MWVSQDLGYNGEGGGGRVKIPVTSSQKKFVGTRLSNIVVPILLNSPVMFIKNTTAVLHLYYIYFPVTKT